MIKIEKGNMFTIYNIEYGHVLYECVNTELPCSCGANDGVQMEIVCNDNMHGTEDEVIPYNHKKFISFTFCYKSIIKDLGKNNLRKLSPQQVKIKKRQLLDDE